MLCAAFLSPRPRLPASPEPGCSSQPGRRCRRATVAAVLIRQGPGAAAARTRSSRIPAPSAAGCRGAPVLRAAGTESYSQRARLLPGTWEQPSDRRNGSLFCTRASFWGSEGGGTGTKTQSTFPTAVLVRPPASLPAQTAALGLPVRNWAAEPSPVETRVCVWGGVTRLAVHRYIYRQCILRVCVCVCLYMKAVCVCWIFLGVSTQIQRFRHLCCMCVIYGLLRYIYKGTRVHIGCTFNKMCMVFQILEAPRPPACPFSSSPRLPFTLFSACGTRPGLPRRHTPHSLCLLRCVSQRLRRLPIPLVRAASSSERPQEQHSRLPPAPSRTKRARAGKWQEPSASPCIAPSQRLV